MSEHLNNQSEKLKKLYEFTSRLVNGENGRMLFDTYRQWTDRVNAEEAMQVLDLLLENGYPLEKVKDDTGKIINVFFKSLDSKEWEIPGEGHFLHYMMLENRAVEKIIEDIRPVIKSVLSGKVSMSGEPLSQLRIFIDTLRQYELHYVKKENILFPYIEKKFAQHGCLKIMWSFHDDFRRSLKILDSILKAENPDIREFNVGLGDLFFTVLPLIFREEKIVYPVAYKYIPEEDWHNMLEQSTGLGWCYGVSPLFMDNGRDGSSGHDGITNLVTGALTRDQIVLMLNHLPVEMTFVDENDEVKYFSGAEHRIFPRSAAIIGRKVQNCHPPESVHIVNEIIEAFRSGKKDHADFWITMKGKFIHIRYFALRDESGQYRGTLEVSQDVTEIRSLTGEQRLLDWRS